MASAGRMRTEAPAENYLFQHRRSPIGVLLVDDHEIVRAACRLALGNATGISVVAEACDGETACLRYRELAPDVVLLDINMPGMDGIETTRHIRTHDPDARILIFSSHDNPDTIQRALDAGAAGYLDKGDSPRLVAAIHQTAQGEAL